LVVLHTTNVVGMAMNADFVGIDLWDFVQKFVQVVDLFLVDVMRAAAKVNAEDLVSRLFFVLLGENDLADAQEEQKSEHSFHSGAGFGYKDK
jgi:hypothetical protein